ncbi:MAG TPA: acylneuraminate cytidylyltransferase family protein [Bacteroidales bacterium]|nr:acylneuraminate cytidylyltransferase family protein [Bacteroidales bacterium]
MYIVSLIPAREGSKGIPKKNLALLNGKPLIYYVIQSSLNSICHDTFVSSDGPDILGYAMELGTKVIEQPPIISGDRNSIEEVITYFTERIEYDILVLLAPTSPLIESKHINDGVEKILVHGYDSAIGAMGMEKNDILFWDGIVRYPVNYELKKRGVRQDREENRYYIETGGLYVTTKKQFLQSKCRVGGNVGFVEIPFWNHFEIDTPEDLKMIECIMRGKDSA